MTIVSNDAQIANAYELLVEAKKLVANRLTVSTKYNDPNANPRLDRFKCQWQWQNIFQPYQGTVMIELSATWESVSMDDKGIVSFRPNSVRILHEFDGKTEWIEAYLKSDSRIDCTSNPSNHLLWLLNRPWQWHTSKSA
ncbi:MAG: hypothetical protein JWN75_901 [Candidatus Saccharibacteria bacterium]|nr:hypothetical protein [Candidatus Saccharibacteria bacterium]